MTKLYNDLDDEFVVGKGSMGGGGGKTRTKKKQQSNPDGKFTSKHVRISQAKIESAKKKKPTCNRTPKL
jgi:hypothetical protein